MTLADEGVSHLSRLCEPVHFLLATRRQLRQFLMTHYPVPEYIAQYAAKL